MPLFHIDKNKITTAKLINFGKEREIQTLIENNLEVVFNCKFIESEFSTGSEHAGRIDTIALSEDNNPVIIEYKKNASSELVTKVYIIYHGLKTIEEIFKLRRIKILEKT